MDFAMQAADCRPFTSGRRSNPIRWSALLTSTRPIRSGTHSESSDAARLPDVAVGTMIASRLRAGLRRAIGRSAKLLQAGMPAPETSDAWVFVAHPDDELIYAGAAILSNPRRRWHIVIATHGLESARAAEAIAVGAALRERSIAAEYHFFGHPDKRSEVDGGIDCDTFRSQGVATASRPNRPDLHPRPVRRIRTSRTPGCSQTCRGRLCLERRFRLLERNHHGALQ